MQAEVQREVTGIKIMSSRSSLLLPLIVEEIEAAGGIISFARFMELALYHDRHGYYGSGRARIGKEGDFFTNVSVGRIYGRLLSSVCREVWEVLGCPEKFTIIEQGANDGRLASDLLGATGERDDGFSRAVHYRIVEPISANQEQQAGVLHRFPNVAWSRSLDELPCFTGIHLSNELLDAFPVHSLCWNGTQWLQESVSYDSESLSWVRHPILDPLLANEAGHLPVNLPEGFRLEVNLGMKPWLESIHQRMERGVVLTIDYGQAGEDRYAPHRADGTLQAYQGHRRFHDPLQDPGLRDITAQVDFTALATVARKTGFTILGYSDQHHFLVGAAEPWLRSLGDSALHVNTDLRALQTLLHPATMGRQFKAIALGKGLSDAGMLACFKHQRPGTGILMSA